MKIISLFIAFVWLAGSSFGQVLPTAMYAPGKVISVTGSSILPTFAKGGGDTIWHTSFGWENPDDPRGWMLPDGWEIKDNTDLGNYWVWTKDSVYSGFWYEAPPPFFKTREDGFLCLPFGYYNSKDGLITRTPADSYIQAPPVDCSAVSSVVVRFSQYYTWCCTNPHFELLVSNDNGAHWSTYDMLHGVTANVATPARYQNMEINVSDVAAGSPNVLLRFYMWGNSHYFWFIDDLALVEAYEHDLALEETWMDFDGGLDATIDQINYWPLSQMGMTGETSGTVGNYFMKGAVLNKGISDADNTRLNLRILKNGNEIRNTSSQEKSIWSLDRDTLFLDPFLANDYGDYRFDFTAVHDFPDEVEKDNTTSMYFTVNDTLAHRADFTAESQTSTGGWVGGGNAGDMVCVFYRLYAAAEISSITAFIANFTASESPQFQFVMFKNIGGEMEEWCSSAVMDMDSSYRFSWVTLPILKDGENEYLEPGEYATCVRMWGSREGDVSGTSGITVGWDLSTKFSGCAQYYAYGDNHWTYLAGNPLFMIGFNINESGAPTEAPVTFNVDMNKHIANGEFIPGTDFMDLSGSFNGWNSSDHMTDGDGDGIYTITIDRMPVGKVIEFKYRINGNWDTSEFPNGEPNRKYTVRYWNVLNHVYNNGITTGVQADGLVACFSVYPNPSSGKFTLEVVNASATDIGISLLNVQGQVIYRNQVKDVVQYSEIIGDNLSKGIYFLRISDSREIKIQKVIVE